MRKTLNFVAALGLILSATSCVNSDSKKAPEGDFNCVSKCDSVDLGLTSGTKWASCNVGADKPEASGEYFAWGETKSKEVYADTTYAFYVLSDSVAADSLARKTWKHIGSDIAGTEYDAATVIMGDAWKMPTEAQAKELIDECEWTWVEVNGVNGYKVAGKNGNSIFLPATGLKGSNDVVNGDMIGGFWTSTECTAEETNGDFAMAVRFFSESHALEKGGRGYGRSIRAVVK